MSSLIRDIKERVSIPGLVLVVLFISVIWGNSLVAGEGSGSLSAGVMEWVQGLLQSLGLPFAWVTNFLIRKAAHFTEYFILALLSSYAFDPKRSAGSEGVVAACVLCVLVSSIDETIQLFVPGRCGQVTDVLIDCSGAFIATFIRSTAVRWYRRREYGRNA
ncbi:MAG: VanZ family protein [Collinsella intestinalis]|uniref:VanZ like family protein n=1 Tax=Collinsella intestinalis TaxID=147207 RepID=A0A5K1IRE0_9ACTN|nr:VanZ family protein [Collinsella intestinalis]VWL90959.1 VanZ like family protein [Collinsella intestinalis]